MAPLSSAPTYERSNVDGKSQHIEHEQVDGSSSVECEFACQQWMLVKLGEQIEEPLNLVKRARRKLPYKCVIHDCTSSLLPGRTSRHLATQLTDLTPADPRR